MRKILVYICCICLCLSLTACDLLRNPDKTAQMEKNIAALAKTDAAMTIAEEVYRIIGR